MASGEKSVNPSLNVFTHLKKSVRHAFGAFGHASQALGNAFKWQSFIEFVQCIFDAL